jgi:MFS family permease
MATAFTALQAQYYPRVWASGWLWSITRWMAVFAASYYVNQQTDSPFLVQLVGAAFFGPMFFAGALGGVVSDRFDRVRTLQIQAATLAVVTAFAGVTLVAGVLEVWMLYPILLVIGLGGVLDMTSRRALVYDLVGDARLTNAMALESLALTGSMMVGNFTGGAIIAASGVGEVFLLIAAGYCASFALVRGVRPPRRLTAPAVSIRRDLAAGFKYVRRHRTLVSILGITIIINAFHFTYTPMVPVFAERLGVGALLTGLLGGAMGLGSVVGSLWIASNPGHHRGVIYVGGGVLGMVALFAFAAVAWYPAAFFSLVVVGVGMAGFATMQAALVMATATPEMRGRAMGLLSMSIGALPLCMIALGLVAQEVGAPAAVMGSVAIGLLAMLAWNIAYPEARRIE